MEQQQAMIQIRPLLWTHLLIRPIHHLTMIPLLTVGDVHFCLVIIEHGLLLPPDQKEEETILDQSRGLRVEEWTEIRPHCCLLVIMDEIRMMVTIVMRTAINKSKIKTEIDILLLLIGRDG